MNNEANNLTENEMMTLDHTRLDQIEPTLKKSRVYEEWIDDLSCDVQVKNILKGLLDITCKVGNKLYQIGKAVLEFFLKYLGELKEKYPYTCDLAVIGCLASILFWNIPFIGPFVGPLLSALMTAAGAIVGLALDLNDKFEMIRKAKEYFC